MLCLQRGLPCLRDTWMLGMKVVLHLHGYCRDMWSTLVSLDLSLGVMKTLGMTPHCYPLRLALSTCWPREWPQELSCTAAEKAPL